MVVLVDVVLNEGVNQDEFAASYEGNANVELKHLLENLPNQLVYIMDESYVETFAQDARVASAEIPPEAVPASPTYDVQSGIVVVEGASYFNTSYNGADLMPQQIYADSDSGDRSVKYGNMPTFGDTQQGSVSDDKTYYSAFSGEHIDIVTLEAGATSVSSTWNSYHTGPHPDFSDPDNTATSRFVPMNWPGLTSAENNQVTSPPYFSPHSIGVLSAAAGRVCGFAKRASMRAMYFNEGVTNCVNSVISFHNNKSTNSTTGYKNPTILILEFQYLNDTKYVVPVSDVASVTDANGTVTKASGGWGSGSAGDDFTAFTDRNIQPFRVDLSGSGNWQWCIRLPLQSESTALKNALESAWNAGIVVVAAAGNGGGVYVRRDDARKTGVYITTDSAATRYLITNTNYVVTGFVGASSNNANWYPFYAYGPHGCADGTVIDVAAGQSSMGAPLLDVYSNRGPGIDIIGRGADTFTASPGNTLADGQWGYFSGTSCAAPTVAGKIACEMEKYLYYHGSYPTNNQVRTIIAENSVADMYGVEPVDWSSVTSASTSYSVSEVDDGPGRINLLEINDHLNGGVRLSSLAGTPSRRAFFDGRGFKRSSTRGARNYESTGPMYPRPNVRIASAATSGGGGGTAPTVSGSTSISIIENTSTSTVLATYTATGTTPITWSVTGTDASNFNINSSGQLTFAVSPDYETPADRSQSINVVATNSAGSDSHAVSITVTDDTSDNSGGGITSFDMGYTAAGQNKTAPNNYRTWCLERDTSYGYTRYAWFKTVNANSATQYYWSGSAWTSQNVTRTFTALANGWLGLADSGTLLCGVDSNGNISIVNKSTGSQVASGSHIDNLQGVLWDGTYFWAGSFNTVGRVVRITTSGVTTNYVLPTFGTGKTNNRSAFYDFNKNYYYFGDTFAAHAYTFNGSSFTFVGQETSTEWTSQEGEYFEQSDGSKYLIAHNGTNLTSLTPV